MPLSPDLLFVGQSEASSILRATDWADSPLGEPARWPAPLRAAVALSLGSRLPMAALWGPNLHLIYNDAFAPIFGPNHPAAMSQPCWGTWPDARAVFNESLQEVLAGESRFLEDIEIPHFRNSASEHAWFTFSLSPLRADDGSILGIFVTASETTNKVAAERQRAAQTARLQRLVEQAPGFIAVTRGPGHVYEIVNQSHRKLMGPRNLIGLPARVAVPELEGQGFHELLDEVYATGKPFVGHSIPAALQRVPGGPLEDRYVNFIYQPIFDENDAINGIFIEGSDVTEQHLAQLASQTLNDQLAAKMRRLKEADQRKDDFLAMLAHELRNPLAPISSAAALLARAPTQDPLLRSSANVICRQVRHMASLLDDLLDVSRVTRGLIALDKTIVDATRAAGEAVEQARPLIEIRQHKLETRISEIPLHALADSKRLVQIVVNLLVNSAKYTPEGGDIRLDVESSGRDLVIRVSDTGIGMAPDTIDRVFDLFMQGERSSDRSAGGMGLGLALVRSLVTLHGGVVEARSDGLGRGSCFTVRLPLEEPPPVTEEAPLAAEGDSPHLRLLIVDDNVDAAETLAAILEAGGHVTAVAHDGEAALAMARLNPPEACLLDIGMPRMDGHELARRMRADPALKGATLIALTGYGDEAARGRAAQAGFDHHLVKPVDFTDLRDLLARVKNDRAD